MSEAPDQKQSLIETRNNFQEIVNDIRSKRVELGLQNRDRQIGFIRKVGELSFTFGAAIAPLLVISQAAHKTKGLPFIWVGISLYLINGVLALWKVKTSIEADADDAPRIGIDSEKQLYEIIYAHNRLIFQPDNTEYIQAYKTTMKDSLGAADNEPEDFEPKLSYWLDTVIILFVIATLMVGKALWSYSLLAFWIIFTVAILLLVGLVVFSAIKSYNKQRDLYEKKKDIRKLKQEFQEWKNKNFFDQ